MFKLLLASTLSGYYTYSFTQAKSWQTFILVPLLIADIIISGVALQQLTRSDELFQQVVAPSFPELNDISYIKNLDAPMERKILISTLQAENHYIVTGKKVVVLDNLSNEMLLKVTPDIERKRQQLTTSKNNTRTTIEALRQHLVLLLISIFFGAIVGHLLKKHNKAKH